MKILLVWLVVGALTGCATIGNSPSPLALTYRGEQPTVCYVRARNFHGFVPMSCVQAEQVRP